MSTPTLSPSLSTPTRTALLSASLLATALYAASFALLDDADRLLPIAVSVAVAAVVSWPLFGLVLIRISPTRAHVDGFFDACLLAIAGGEVLLLAAAGVNVALTTLNTSLTLLEALASIHLALLLLADALMAAIFTTRVRPLGLSAGWALALWVGALNVAFALLLVPLLLLTGAI